MRLIRNRITQFAANPLEDRKMLAGSLANETGPTGNEGQLNETASQQDGDASPQATSGSANRTVDADGNTIINSGEVTATISAEELSNSGFDDATQEKALNGFGDAVQWWDERITQGGLNIEIKFGDLEGANARTTPRRITSVTPEGVTNGVVEFNRSSIEKRSRAETTQTTAHELGHVVSLAHLPRNAENILAGVGSTSAEQAQARLDGGLTEEQLATVADYGLRERPNFVDEVQVETASGGETTISSGEVTATFGSDEDLDDETLEKLSNSIARGISFWDEFVTQGSLETEIVFIDIPQENAAIRADSGKGIDDRTGRIEIDLEEFQSLTAIEAEGLLARTLGRNLGLANQNNSGTIMGTFREFEVFLLETAFSSGPNAEQLGQIQEIGLRGAAAGTPASA